MVKEIRVVKGYKVKQSIYNKAMKHAKKNKVSLATIIEMWVKAYAKGYSVGIINQPLYDTGNIPVGATLYTDMPLTKSNKGGKK